MPMDSRQQQNEAMEMLARHEEAIADLYDTYARKFPEFKSFWQDLSAEETQHASWIRQLIWRIEDGSGHINKAKFQAEAIDSSLDYIAELSNQAEKTDFAVKNAFTLALNIEEAMLEKKYFEAFEGDSPQIKQLLLRLAEATQNHAETIRKVIAENK